jgi:hypothetical protein
LDVELQKTCIVNPAQFFTFFLRLLPLSPYFAVVCMRDQYDLITAALSVGRQYFLHERRYRWALISGFAIWKRDEREGTALAGWGTVCLGAWLARVAAQNFNGQFV